MISDLFTWSPPPLKAVRTLSQLHNNDSIIPSCNQVTTVLPQQQAQPLHPIRAIIYPPPIIPYPTRKPTHHIITSNPINSLPSTNNFLTASASASPAITSSRPTRATPSSSLSYSFLLELWRLPFSLGAIAV